MSSFSVISFDPGFTLTGWTFGIFDIDKNKLHIHETGLLTASKIVSRVNMREAVEYYGKTIVASCTLRTLVKELYDLYHPDFVCAENTFFNPRTPTAYASLLIWLTTVSLFLKDQYQARLFRISPKEIKMIISSKGDAGKLKVQNSVLKNENITFEKHLDPNQFVEHQWDAIAISWTFCQLIYPTLIQTNKG